jgi:hypothetical protein
MLPITLRPVAPSTGRDEMDEHIVLLQDGVFTRSVDSGHKEILLEFLGVLVRLNVRTQRFHLDFWGLHAFHCIPKVRNGLASRFQK